MTSLTPELKAKIDGMTRVEMASRWRFAPIGDPLFQGESGVYFAQRFKELDGMSPEISKHIGWDKED